MKHRRRNYTWRMRPVPRSMPKHLRDNQQRWWRLYSFANGMRGLLGVPIYLCGSALRDDNPDPRDWDIRITLSDTAFERRYGSVEQWMRQGETGNWGRERWRWSDECVKYTKQACERTHLNIDLQIYPRSYALGFKEQPRRRIDTRGR